MGRKKEPTVAEAILGVIIFVIFAIVQIIKEYWWIILIAFAVIAILVCVIMHFVRPENNRNSQINIDQNYLQNTRNSYNERYESVEEDYNQENIKIPRKKTQKQKVKNSKCKEKTEINMTQEETTENTPKIQPPKGRTIDL